MGLFLKSESGMYLKNIDSANGTIELTPFVSEAKHYSGGEWFAETELEYVKFHFKDNEDVKTMRTVIESS